MHEKRDKTATFSETRAIVGDDHAHIATASGLHVWNGRSEVRNVEGTESEEEFGRKLHVEKLDWSVGSTALVWL